MASPAPSPRGTPPSLKDRLSEPLGDPLSIVNLQKTASSAVTSAECEEQQRASSKLLSFAPAAVAAIVSPLPPRVASRWGSSDGRPLSGSLATRHSIDAKLAAAEAKRQASFFKGLVFVTFFLGSP